MWTAYILLSFTDHKCGIIFMIRWFTTAFNLTLFLWLKRKMLGLCETWVFRHIFLFLTVHVQCSQNQLLISMFGCISRMHPYCLALYQVCCCCMMFRDSLWIWVVVNHNVGLVFLDVTTYVSYLVPYEPSIWRVFHILQAYYLSYPSYRFHFDFTIKYVHMGFFYLVLPSCQS